MQLPSHYGWRARPPSSVKLIRFELRCSFLRVAAVNTRLSRYVQVHPILAYSTDILYVSDRLVSIKETQNGSRWFLSLFSQQITPVCRHCWSPQLHLNSLGFVPARLLDSIADLVLCCRPPGLLAFTLPYALPYRLTPSDCTFRHRPNSNYSL